MMATERFYGVDRDANRTIDVPMCTRHCPCARCRAERGELVIKPASCGKTEQHFGRARG